MASAAGVRPSLRWSGIDGTWSTFDLKIGDPPQNVSLLASTGLSEIWVIETTGCSPSKLCAESRGGLFDVHTASLSTTNGSWQALGAWSTGFTEQGLGPTNGDYGLDVVTWESNTNVSVTKALIAGINDTSHYLGYIGLGTIAGNFTGQTISPLISQLAESQARIPSHSYGYTAGAYYSGRTAASLTFGGYDLNRINVDKTVGASGDGQDPFNSHHVPTPQFNINPATREPVLLLRGITAMQSSVSDTSSISNTTSLTAWAPGTLPPSALIDTTTPFLWLPQDVCANFASTLGLAFNSTYNLYTFASPDQYDSHQNGHGPSLVFSLSSIDNSEPGVSGPGVTNLTISSAAFALAAKYPYLAGMQYGDAPIPYFPLKCFNGSASNSNRIVIGRAFFQEVYMIMDYESNRFGLYPARLSGNQTVDGGGAFVPLVHLIDIPRPPGSTFPVGGSRDGNDQPPSLAHSLSAAAIAGLVVSAVVVCTLAVICLRVCCRRKKAARRKADTSLPTTLDDDGSKSQASSNTSTVDRRRNFVGRAVLVFALFFSARFASNKTSKISEKTDCSEESAAEIAGSFKQPVEVGADAQHARYELPVPLPPVELDATAGGGSGHPIKLDDALVGGGVVDDFDDGYGYCDYSDATAVLGSDGTRHLTAYDVARRRMQRQLRGPAPVYSPPQSESESFHNEHPVSEPSQQSPTSIGGSSMLPSPMTPSSADWPMGNLTHITSHMSSSSASRNGTFDLVSPMSVAAPYHPFFFSRGHGLSSAPASTPSPTDDERPADSTLGTNYTLEEEARRVKDSAQSPGERIDGADLVHVPQLAAQRYSWEGHDSEEKQ